MQARGMLQLTVANAVYIIGGYALTVILARTLGTSGFGDYGVVTAFITILNMLVTRGAPIAISRRIAASPDETGVAMRDLIRVMLPLSWGLAALGVVMSWPTAHLLGDPALAFPMQIGALAAVSFGFQSTMFAWRNGTHNYVRQAWGQSVYGVGRVVTIVGGAYVAGLPGAIIGFVMAPLLAALPLLGRLPIAGAGAMQRRREVLASAVPIVTTTTGVTLLMLVDLLAFKYVGSSSDVGIYTAAATLAHVPWFLLQAAGFVLMPKVAAAASDTERAAAVRDGITDTLILVALPTAVLVAVGDRALTFIYGSGFDASTMLVPQLAIATAGVTLHGALVAVDTAMHRMRATVMIALAGNVALASGVLVAGAGSDLAGAATAVAVICVGIALVHALLVWRRVGPLVAPRIAPGIALAAAVGASQRLVDGSMAMIALGTTIGGLCFLAAVIRLGILRIRPATPTSSAQPEAG